MVRDLEQHLGPRFPRKRQLPRENFVEDDPQRKHVCAKIDFVGAAFRLLRTHVGWGPFDNPGLRGRNPLALFVLVDFLGKPPIQHQHNPVFVDHDVLGFDVPVDDPARVGIGHRLADLPEYGQQAGDFPPVKAVPFTGIQHLAERVPLDALHRIEQPRFLMGANFEDWHHSGVVHIAKKHRLIHKPFTHRPVGGHLGTKRLHRDRAVEIAVVRRIHEGHAALADAFPKTVTRAGLEGR